MKKINVAFMAILILSFIFTSVASALAPLDHVIKFRDVKESHWAYDSIYAAVDQGIVNGYTDGTFKPDQSVTRAEFIKMLILALGVSHSQEGSQWYQTYVNAAMTAGLHDENDFSNQWNQMMTRLEMVRIAVRAINQPYSGNHTDAEFMLEAVSKGIILGMGGGELAEDGLTTRAQALTVIDRILNVIAGHELPVDEQAVKQAEMKVEYGFYHYALESGHISDIDTIEVAKPFFEKFKDVYIGVREFGTAEKFEAVIKGKLDLVDQMKVVLDVENERFLVTIPSGDGVNYLVQLATMETYYQKGGTYEVPFKDIKEDSGFAFRISISDRKVNSSNLYTEIVLYKDNQLISLKGSGI